MPTTTHQTFKLIAPIYSVPAGATGYLNRIDTYHVALIFDNYEDLVFDIYDTEPEVWEAIQPLHTANPSMVDPPVKRWSPRAIAATVGIAFMVGWMAMP